MQTNHLPTRLPRQGDRVHTRDGSGTVLLVGFRPARENKPAYRQFRVRLDSGNIRHYPRSKVAAEVIP